MPRNILGELGVHFEANGSEATAAAMLVGVYQLSAAWRSDLEVNRGHQRRV